MIVVVPLKRIHFEQLGIEDQADRIIEPARGWALEKDGIAVAAGGIMIPHNRVAVVWTQIEQCRQSAFLMRRIHYAAKHILESLKQEFDRIQAEVMYDDKKACHWPRRFGFRYEGKMRMYYEGKTYLRFAWTRG